LKERNQKEIESYLIEKINPQISESSKQFNGENTNYLLKTLGWNPVLIEEYLNNINSYKNVESIK